MVAQNPGLANPEISKIIGERWREESDEHKEQWKRLAEEEKVRHQRQYPDYRYQPRRGGKQAAAAASRGQTPTSAGGEDPGRCPKCGGRYIATPRTPSTPFPFTGGTPTSRGTTPTASGSTSGSMSYHHNQRVVEADHHLRHGSYSEQPQQHQAQHRGGQQHPPPPHYPSSYVYHQQQQHHHYQPRSSSSTLHGISEDYDMESPSSAPGPSKRRRYDSTGGGNEYANSPSYAAVQHQQQQYSYAPQQHQQQQPYPLPHHVRPPPPQQQQHPAVHHRHPSVGGGPSLASPAYAPLNAREGGPLAAPHVSGPRGSIVGMAPPPRPGSVAYPPPPPVSSSRRDATAAAPPGGGGGFDESLRLPPLQTPTTTAQQQQQHLAAPSAGQPGSPASVGTAGTVSLTQSQQRERDLDSQARGVEAMIMSIPYINKIKVLEKIAPPPPLLGGNRGPIIAIEGAVPGLVRQVGQIIERALANSGECKVRVWSGSGGGEEGKREREREKSGESGVQQQQRLGGVGFADCLTTITEWHGRSAEIVKYITSTTAITPAGTAEPEPARRESDVSMASCSSGEEKKSNNANTGGGEATRSKSVSTAASASQQQKGQQQRGLIPVALLADGFRLTISDRFACRVPIADAYAPVDHWQWMATLWRGIVGPDLVVYVRGAEEEEMTRLQAVEMAAGAENVMKVRVVVPPGVGVAGGAAMDTVLVGEKVERRLGFEVVEWVRNGSFKEGV